MSVPTSHSSSSLWHHWLFSWSGICQGWPREGWVEWLTQSLKLYSVHHQNGTCWSHHCLRRGSLEAIDVLTMNPSLALQKQWGYFLPELRDECMCCSCWQTSFTVYKYHSTCSLLQWQYIRFACCRQGEISSDNCYWKKSSVCASYIWPYSTMELSDKMYTQIGNW